MKLSPEQIEERKTDRREARSALRTRLVGEFIKIAFIAVFFILVGWGTWCFILMGRGVVVNYLLPLGIATTLVGVFGTYAAATTAAKKSLNDNDLVKNKDGTITKVVSAVASVVSNVVSGAKDDSGAAAG